MLKNKILELILTKYAEISESYSKSLDITSKILSLLNEKDITELTPEFDEREKAFFSAEVKLKEAAELSKQFARDKFLKDASFDEIEKIDPEYAQKIRDARAAAIKTAEELQKLDKSLVAHFENAMNEIKSKLGKIDSTKMLKKKYTFKHLNFGVINTKI